jgi:hypothetical protein
VGMTIITQVLDTTANVPVWAQPVAGLLRPQSACSISAFLDHNFVLLHDFFAGSICQLLCAQVCDVISKGKAKDKQGRMTKVDYMREQLHSVSC